MAVPTIVQAPARPAPGRAPARGARLLRRLLDALEVHRQRRALRELPDELLKDIGVTRADVSRETGRPFWDLPRDP
jgi:uncharacterized protein YjiS (DUF1127 family)